MSMNENFSLNLRCLCADRGSISLVCREIGINRQQFNRYINGESLPAAYNLRRISSYFKLPESDLFESNDIFLQKHLKLPKHLTGTPVEILSTAFSDQSKSLRRYLGYYHVFVVSPSWEGRILCSLTQLYEQNGFVVSKTLQRAKSRDGTIRQRATFKGLSSLRGNRIYIVERENGDQGSIVETILLPAHRQQVNYLRGKTMGVASKPTLTPYFSNTIWKRIDERISAREAILKCGAYELSSRMIEPTIKDFLTQERDKSISQQS